MESTASHLPTDVSDASTASIIEGNEIDVLDRIDDRRVDLVLFHRTFPADFQDWIDNLPLDEFPTGRVLVKSGNVEKAILPLFSDETREHPAAQILLNDIKDLCHRFAQVTGTDFIDIRLEALRGDACWKFHRDCVSVRLLSTYKGPGTQIVPDANVDEALEDQRDYTGPLRELDLNTVAFFKGSESDSSTGVLHRSPPISDTGQTRFFLCLNLPSRASPEHWENY